MQLWHGVLAALWGLLVYATITFANSAWTALTRAKTEEAQIALQQTTVLPAAINRQGFAEMVEMLWGSPIDEDHSHYSAKTFTARLLLNKALSEMAMDETGPCDATPAPVTNYCTGENCPSDTELRGRVVSTITKETPPQRTGFRRTHLRFIDTVGEFKAAVKTSIVVALLGTWPQLQPDDITITFCQRLHADIVTHFKVVVPAAQAKQRNRDDAVTKLRTISQLQFPAAATTGTWGAITADVTTAADDLHDPCDSGILTRPALARLYFVTTASMYYTLTSLLLPLLWCVWVILVAVTPGFVTSVFAANTKVAKRMWWAVPAAAAIGVGALFDKRITRYGTVALMLTGSAAAAAPMKVPGIVFAATTAYCAWRVASVHAYHDQCQSLSNEQCLHRSTLCGLDTTAPAGKQCVARTPQLAGMWNMFVQVAMNTDEPPGRTTCSFETDPEVCSNLVPTNAAASCVWKEGSCQRQGCAQRFVSLLVPDEDADMDVTTKMGKILDLVKSLSDLKIADALRDPLFDGNTLGKQICDKIP